MVLPPRLEMACPRVACTVNYWICEKQHNCRQWSHTFCAFYILYRITQWGEGKSTSIMQSPAAYTLLVKLLTSTNDFLMIGPSIPQSCLLTHTHTHTARYTHSLPHTFIMTFIKGSTCDLMDHCKCHSHSCIVKLQENVYFSHVTNFSVKFHAPHE